MGNTKHKTETAAPSNDALVNDDPLAAIEQRVAKLESDFANHQHGRGQEVTIVPQKTKEQAERDNAPALEAGSEGELPPKE